MEWALFGPVLDAIQRSDRFDGVVLGDVAWHLLRSRRREAIRNAARCVGDRAEAVARESFRSFGRTLAEALRLSRQAPVVTWREPDALTPLLRERTPVIILSGHLGNWEAAAWAIQRQAERVNSTLHLIVASPSNPRAASYTSDLRQSWGVTPHRRDASLKPLVRALRQGDPIGTAGDQYPGHDAVRRGDVIRAPFFGQDTPFSGTLFRLAERTGSPIVLPTAVRTDGGFDIFTERIDGGTAEDLCRNWVRALENRIRDYPEQYLWMHRRWKHEA